jgi:hypothetical protein
LTRQKAELEERLDLVTNEYQKLRESVDKSGDGKRPSVMPVGADPLGHIWSETDLDKEVKHARGLRQFCITHANGVEDDKGVFHSPEEIAEWRAGEQFSQAKSHFDGLARQEWPELFDQKTPEYQRAAAMLRELEGPNGAAMLNYCLGLAIEGMKARDARKLAAAGSNGNGADKRKADLDQRFLRPRVPAAPHTANPPSRAVEPSSKKQVNEAMKDLVADPDGGADALARVFAARSEAAGSRANPRAPVTV